ncbi:hypothetical protein ES677_06405 [Bizionia gelidisalsuginis]|uniref:Uncharacterized protein n=2 Tax=Bizionia TaxID=283785 RepID=A0A8H2LF57_9FLAO|nr:MULTISPECIES: hypothetical protein [Bizionia]TYB76637.1 hypothetical protein ES676_04645 [Bizionia saleffrena]TYC14170.1 hypothetical protein ES677_06405 [Bizionia gelidisalsuginis]
MKFRFAFLFIVVCAFRLSAQVDRENTSIIIPAEAVEDPKEDNELIINPEPVFGATPAASNTEVKIPKKEELPVARRRNFSITNETKFRNPAELYQDQLKNALKLRPDDERRQNGSTVTQYLGEFSTSAARVNIVYRDHQYPDGDLIRVYVNGEMVRERVLLETHFKGLFLTLEPGLNVIDFEALNQGSSGPNTAQFEVLDDKGIVISSNQWNLATGVKATITLVKEEDSVKNE